MATRAASLSKPDRQGHYARQLGWKINQSGKRVQHKFRLCTDRSAAEVREALLRCVWDTVEKRATSQAPAWTDGTLEIANQVAKGADLIRISTDDAFEPPDLYRRRLQVLQQRYLFLRFTPADPIRFKKSLTNEELSDDGIVLDRVSEALQRRRLSDSRDERFDRVILPEPDIAVVAKSIESVAITTHPSWHPRFNRRLQLSASISGDAAIKPVAGQARSTNPIRLESL